MVSASVVVVVFVVFVALSLLCFYIAFRNEKISLVIVVHMVSAYKLLRSQARYKWPILDVLTNRIVSLN